MYHVKKYIPEGCTEGLEAAVSDLDGSYIGDVKFAESLRLMGIAAMAKPGHKVASIGFNDREQKWYGWSHRAIFGFGIGSEVKRGDCAYVPTDWDDLIDDAKRFWSDDEHEEVTARRSHDDQGKPCVKVQWVYCSDPKVIPNTKIHGQTRWVVMYPPDQWGRGEWKAETLEDARQMACDFAEGVG